MKTANVTGDSKMHKVGAKGKTLTVKRERSMNTETPAHEKTPVLIQPGLPPR